MGEAGKAILCIRLRVLFPLLNVLVSFVQSGLHVQSIRISTYEHKSRELLRVFVYVI
jgi:hypothetical protein